MSDQELLEWLRGTTVDSFVPPDALWRVMRLLKILDMRTLATMHHIMETEKGEPR